MDLQRIRERLSNKPEQEVEQVIYVVEKYNLKFTVRNFDQFGILFRDEQGKTVRVLNGVMRNNFVHTVHPHAEVAIVFVDGLLSGWVEQEKMEDLQDRMSISPKSLHKMPTSFSFNQQCPHMDVYGGFYEGDFWECAGCGERLVFSDN